MFTLQSSFFASFMCFDLKPLAPQLVGDDENDEDDTSLDAVHTKASECTILISDYEYCLRHFKLASSCSLNSSRIIILLMYTSYILLM